MGALNTIFNGATARNTAATARNTAATARATGQLADADRLRELRQRGWITPSSTPYDVAAVEAILAAQMRARVEQQVGRPWPFRKVAIDAGIAVGLVLLLAIGAFTKAKPVPGALLLLLLVAAIAGIAVLVVQRREDRRSRALARAVVRDGLCQWCQGPAPHTVEGETTDPRVHHALDIERAIDPCPR